MQLICHDCERTLVAVHAHKYACPMCGQLYQSALVEMASMLAPESHADASRLARRLGLSIRREGVKCEGRGDVERGARTMTSTYDQGQLWPDS